MRHKQTESASPFSQLVGFGYFHGRRLALLWSVLMLVGMLAPAHAAVPTINSLTPTSGPAGTGVTIDGTSLFTTTSVTFNGVSAAFVKNNAFTLQVTVPSGAPAGNNSVIVTNTSGPSAPYNYFVVTAGITGFTPSAGPVGTLVTINGSALNGTTSVSFAQMGGGTISTAPASVSSSQVTVNVPDGAVTGVITLTTPNGNPSTATTFKVTPRIDDYSTTTDPINGANVGTKVGNIGATFTITGRNFTGTILVRIGTKSCGYTIVNDQTIVATVPTGAVSGQISVTTAAGTTYSGTYYIGNAGSQQPTITSFTASGAVAANITITGTNYGVSVSGPPTDVVVGFTKQGGGTVNGTVVSSTATTITVTVPDLAVHGPLYVTTGAGSTNTTGLASPNFLVAPRITSFTPVLGPTGTVVTITGSALKVVTPLALAGELATPQVNFGSATFAAPSTADFSKPTYESQGVNAGGGDPYHSITATVPPGALTGQINLRNYFTAAPAVSLVGNSAAATPSTTFQAAPMATVVTQTTVGSQTVITGVNLTSNTTVSFSGTGGVGTVPSGAVTFVSSTQIKAIVPFGATHGPIVVSNSAGSHVSGPNTYAASVSPPEWPASFVNFLLTPRIDSFTNLTNGSAQPNSGAPGDSIKITGAGLVALGPSPFAPISPPTVRFNTVFATVTNVNHGASVDELTVTIPAGGGSGNVLVTTQNTGTGTYSGGTVNYTYGGAAANTSSLTFTVGPFITSFTPLSAPFNAAVTITGGNFVQGSSAVKFGTLGVASQNITFISTTSLRVLVPNNSYLLTSGPVPISVTTSGGTAVSSQFFTLSNGGQPTITSFTPLFGLAGTEVTINGTNFTPQMTNNSVFFGASSNSAGAGLASAATGPGFTYVSPTQVKATTPTNVAAGAIKVVTDAGTCFSPTDYTPQAPTILTAVPALTAFTAPIGGTVNIQTSNTGSLATLTHESIVKFTGVSGNQDQPGDNFVWNSNSSVTVTVPSGARTGPVVVQNSAGTSPAPNDGNGNPYYFVPTGFLPVVSGVSLTTSGFTSTALATAGTTRVYVQGINFTPQSTIIYNNQTVASASIDYSLLSTGIISAIVPAGTTTGATKVTNYAGTSAVIATTPQVVIGATGIPTVTAYSPTTGPVGTTVALTGTNFTPGSTVNFFDTQATYTAAGTNVVYISPTLITADVPAAAATGAIRVTNQAATSVNTTPTFTVIPGIPPTVTAISPSSGPAPGSGTGSDDVTITGTGFTSQSTVKFNTTAATNVVFVNSTTLTARVNTGTTTGPVTVTTGASVSAVNASTPYYTITGVVPTVTSITPASGPVGTTSVIVGTNFTPTSTVQYTSVTNTQSPGVAGDNVTFVSSTILRVDAPVGAATGPVKVTTNGVQSTTSATFTIVNPPPSVNSISLDDISYTSTGIAGAAAGTLYIQGTGFLPTSTATNGTGTWTLSQYISATKLAFTFSGVTAVGPVRVTTNSVQSAAISTTPYYGLTTNTPTCTAVAPTSGSEGTVVVLTGTNFTPTSTVQFTDVANSQSPGIAGTNVTWVNATTLRATVPAGAYTGAVKVTNLTGTQSPTGPTFTVNGTTVPTVTGIYLGSGAGTPVSTVTGPANNTQIVTIVGTGFSAGSTVTFNATAGTSFTYVDPTTVRATVNTGTTTGPVKVTTNGLSNVITPSTPTYVIAVPTVTTLTPATGPVGTLVVVTGTNFDPNGTFTFSTGQSATPTFVSSTTLKVTVPAAAVTGTVSYTGSYSGAAAVTGPTFTLTSAAPPTVTGVYLGSGAGTPVSSVSGLANNTQVVTIVGTGFAAGSSVTFNATAGTSFTFVDANTVRATVNTGTTTGPVKVTTGGITSAVGETTPYYVVTGALPTITALAPATGAVGTTVAVTGTNFTPDSTVLFTAADGTQSLTAAAAQFVNTTTMRVNVPGGAITGATKATNAAGTGAAGTSFTVTGTTIPTVTGIYLGTSGTPVSTVTGPATGQVVTVVGSGFAAGSTVAFNGVAGTSVTYVDANTVRATTAAATSGPIRVTTNGIPSAVDTNTPNYVINAAPTITSLTPNSGPIGTTVVIVGTNLTPQTAVNFTAADGTQTVAATVEYISTTTLRVDVPGSAQTGLVKASNAYGLSTGTTFTVTQPSVPTVTSVSPSSGPIGQLITVTGTGFASNSIVSVNGINCTNNVYDSGTGNMTARIAVSTTSGLVRVSTNSVLSQLNASTPSFIVTNNGLPVITAVAPTTGPIGTTTVVTGTGFDPTTTISFATASGTVAGANQTYVSNTTIRVDAPAGAVTGLMSSSNSVGSLTSGTTFTVSGNVQPTVTGLYLGTSGTPTSQVSGPANNSQVLSIVGTGYTPASTVLVNATAPVSTTFVDSTTLRVVVASGTTTGPVKVTTDGVPSTVDASTPIYNVNPTIPTITLAPANGPVGTEVTVTGGPFTPTSTVTFNNGAASATVIYVNTATLRVTVPPTATGASIVNATTNGITSANATFTVYATPPTVTSLSPTSGGTGITVTVTGTNFSATGLAITFNGVAGTTPTFTNATTVSAVVPATATTGPVRVTTTAAGTSALTDTTPVYTVTSAVPTITSLTPNSGPVGTRVLILGTGYTPSATVNFTAADGTQSVAAAGLTYIDSTRLAVTVPSGAITGLVKVTTGSGTSVGTTFTVNGTTIPVVTSISPTTGAATGQAVTINGSGFSAASTVTFNAVANSGTVVSCNAAGTVLNVNTGATAATTGPVRVTTNGIVSAVTPTTPYYVVTGAIPTVTSLSVTSGPAGTTTLITGTNYTPTSTVNFTAPDGTVTVAGDNVTWLSATQIRVDAPSAGATGVVRVTNAAGTSANVAPTGVFTYVTGVPVITSISPSTGAATGQAVTINGSGFTSASVVTFNGVASSGTVTSCNLAGTTLTVNTGPTAATTGPVRVSTNSISSVVDTNTPYYVVTGALPTVTSLSVTSGPVGTTTMITGTNFNPACTVQFTSISSATTQDVSGSNVTFVSATQIRVDAPSGAATGPVKVTNSAGQSTTSATFTYVTGIPTVTSISPSSGTATGQGVTINGTGFTSAAVVTFNGVASSGTVTSCNAAGTQLTVNTGPTAATTGPVRVTVNGVASAVNASTPYYTVTGGVSTVTALSPTSGVVGTSVTLTGTNFTPTGTTVSFNGTAATNVTFVSATSMRADVPSGATTGTVTATNPIGTGAGTAFTVTAGTPPTVTSISPSTGPSPGASNGSNDVTINGTGFTAASVAKFNGTNASPTTFVSSTQLTARVAAGSTTGPVTVLDGTLTSAVTATTPYYVVNNGTTGTIPTVTTLAPTSGPIGTSVVITGTNFTPTSTVQFTDTTGSYSPGVSGDNVLFVSSTTMRADVPATAITGPVVVTNAATTSVPNPTFTVTAGTPPTVTSASPLIGPAPGATNGSNDVTVNGTGFTANTLVRFNGTNAQYTRYISSTQLIARVAQYSTSGPISVSEASVVSAVTASTPYYVVNNNSTGSLPTVTAVAPTSGPAGTTVTLTGTNFTPTTTVQFTNPASPIVNTVATQQDIDAGTVTFVSATLLRVNVPSGGATGGIRATNGAGQAVGTGPVFTYVNSAIPTVTSVSPSSGTYGTVITVSGTGFNYSSTVSVNAVNCTNVSYNSGTGQLTATIALGTTTGPVRVTTNSLASQLSASTPVFRVTSGVVPTVTSLLPTTGNVGTTVLVTGTGYTPVSTVQFSGADGIANVAANNVTYISSTQLRVDVPADAATGAVRVTNTGIQSSTSATFTVVAGTFPTVTSITPSSGPVGTSVTVNGTSFSPNSIVKFNGTTAATTTYVSGTQLTATVAFGSISGPVQVTNGLVTSFVSAATPSFSVTGTPPTVTAYSPTSGVVGTSVTLTGTGFTPTSTVVFISRSGGTVSGDNVLYVNSTTIRVDVPALGSTGPIRVANGADVSQNVNVFTVTAYAYPTVTSISPSFGPAPGAGDGTNDVIVTGTGFTPTSTVTFNATAASYTAFISTTQLKARVAAGTTTGPVKVTTDAAVSPVWTTTPYYTITGAIPTVTSISALGSTNASTATGPIGTEVNINGTNFTPTSVVKFNGVTAQAGSLVYIGTTQVKARVAAGTTTGPVTVTNAAGTNPTINAPTFIVAGVAPTITSFTPTFGIAGTLVTITGTGFTPQMTAANVTFNGTAAGSINYVSSTQIQVTAPAGVTAGPLKASNGSVTSADSTNHYTPGVPTVTTTGVSPTTAAVGIQVTLTGTNFTNNSTVSFTNTAGTGTVLGTSLEWVSNTSIRIRVPTGAGAGPLTVANDAGSSGPATQYFCATGQVPTITSFTPTTAVAGQVVTITGTKFTPQSTVQFTTTAGLPAYATGAAQALTTAPNAFVNTTTIKVAIPSGSATGRFTVTNAAGTSAQSGTLLSISSTTAPYVNTVTPATAATGATITIAGGANLGSVATPWTVTFTGGATASGTVTVANTTLTCAVPAGALSGPVSVTNGSVTSNPSLVYFVPTGAVPTITSFTPSSGPVTTIVTINGTNITPTTTVQFINGTATAQALTTAPNGFVSSTQLQVAVPAGTTSGTIKLNNAAGASALSGSSYTVVP